MAQHLIVDEVGVRCGISGGILFMVTAVVVVGQLPATYGVAVLFTATVVLAGALDGLHAVVLGIAGWGFATGFAVNTLGVLTMSPPDLLRLAVFVCAATVTAGLGCAPRALGQGSAGAE